jgi:hypothetical protein
MLRCGLARAGGGDKWRGRGVARSTLREDGNPAAQHAVVFSNVA